MQVALSNADCFRKLRRDPFTGSRLLISSGILVLIVNLVDLETIALYGFQPEAFSVPKLALASAELNVDFTCIRVRGAEGRSYESEEGHGLSMDAVCARKTLGASFGLLEA